MPPERPQPHAQVDLSVGAEVSAFDPFAGHDRDVPRYRRLRANNPSRVGKFPRAVCRMIRTAGKYRPNFALTRCLIRAGLVKASTCEMPSSRLTRRFAVVYPVSWRHPGRR